MLASLMDMTMMALEILAAEFVFAMALPRKKLFPIRFIGSTVICLETIWLIIFLYCRITDSFFVYESAASASESVFKFFFFIAVFLMSVGCMAFSYKSSIWVLLFYGSGGYAAQHIAKNLSGLIKAIPSVKFFAAGNALWFPYLLDAAVCAALYTLLYFLVLRGRVLPDMKKGIRLKVSVSLIAILICIGLSRISADNSARDTVAFVAESLYAIVGCGLVLFILLTINRNDKMESEVEVMTELLHREKEQYRLSKENIELINIKCHDLKHQISALKQDASEDRIREIEEAVMIYDANVKTGNAVLDVILTEKSLYCEKNGIKLTCVVDAHSLAFMDNMDIYSLFGNALSNAIEQASKIESPTKRVVSVNAQSEGNFLSVHIENYYEGEIVFENGLPVTDGDKKYHGFGMKSMDYIAKRYGGQMSITASEGKFRLDFVFPLSSARKPADGR